MDTFLFISLPKNFQIFEEGKKNPFARVEVMAVELDKISANGRVYAFQDAELMRASLVGKQILYGLTPEGKHRKAYQTIKIGFVESARIVGRKIMAVLKITDSGILETLKAGARNFLCSVGGVADMAKLVVEKAKRFIKMIRPRCTHIQFWQSSDSSEAGFPTAKMTKILEFQESAFFTEDVTVQECDMFGCRVLAQIRRDYEFEEAKRKLVRESIKRKAISRAIAEDIVRIIKGIPELIEVEN